MTRINLFLEPYLQPLCLLMNNLRKSESGLRLKNTANRVSTPILGSRPTSRIALVVAAVMLLIGLTGTTSSAGSFSTELSQLAWFWKPPSDGNLDTLARNYQFFILSRGDEKVRSSLKSKGVTEPIMMYMRFEAIEEESCSGTPHRNQAAWKVGDYCNINRNHSDWFLKDRSGNRIRVDGYFMMDPGNSGWRSFWLSRTREAMQNYGWEGVFMDNLDASFGRFRKMGKYPSRYSSESSYISAVKGMLSYISGSFNSMGKPLMANITHVDNPDIWYQYINYLKGGMAEGWGVDWSSGYRSVSDWEEHVRRVEKTQSMGRHIVAVAQGTKDNYSRQSFAYASFLLGAKGKAAFRYGRAEYYRYAWLYSNYNIDLGSPLGSRYYRDGSWRRDFTRGYVRVNPSSHSYTISGRTSSSSTASSTSKATSGDKVYIKRQAESGTLISPMKKISNSSASGGYHVAASKKTANQQGKAVYSVNVRKPGTYTLWVRAAGRNSKSNRFSVEMDGGISYALNVPTGANWQWRKLTNTFSLSRGTHTLAIQNREGGSKIDRLVLTNDSNYVP